MDSRLAPENESPPKRLREMYLLDFNKKNKGFQITTGNVHVG